MNKKYTIDYIAKYIIKYPHLSDSQIASKFKINRTRIWRARQLTTKVKFSNKNEIGKSVISWEGYDNIKEETINHETRRKEYRVATAAGPIRGKRSLFEPNVFGNTEYDEDIINHWKPYMHLVVNDEKTGSPLSAAEITYRRNTKQKWYPRYFSNPAQSLDYMTFEAHARSTIGGSLLQALVKFIVGRGFKPELELINPGEDSRDNQKEIDSHQDIIRDLIQIEYQLSYDKNGYLDISFQDKIASLILNAITFNRSALLSRYDEPITIDGKHYGNIPSSMQNAHAREIGIIKTNPYTARLEAFQWNNSGGFVDIYDSIYLWNPLISANTFNAMWYGDSFMLPMIDALRVLRTNIGVNFTAMGENAYAGLGVLSIKPEGQTSAEKEAEYTTVSQRMVPATTNIIMKDPDDVKFYNIDYKPEVDSFINMNESLIKYCAATLGMPHAMFYDESASNRACYSEDTLTLTESGWKYYNEIDWRNEKIATLNPENGNIEYHYPDGISVYPYEGEMIHVKTKNQDVLVTPDHDMWVSSSHDERYVKFEKIKAENLTQRKDFVFTEFGNWIGKSVPEQYNLHTVQMNSYGPRIKQQCEQIVCIKTDTWLQFMGYYLSDGTKSRPEKYGSTYFVSVAQNENSKSFDKFKNCMDEMPFNYYDNIDKDKCHRWRFSSKQLVSNLQDTGILHDTKQIPKWMLQLQPKKLEILFNALMEGNGTINKEDSKIYYTTSLQLARDVQELALKLGYGANLKIHYEATQNKSKAYRVFITKNKRHLRRVRSQDVTVQNYKGIVYCFSVKNHLFVTSRNGTVTIQGNTMIGKIQLAISTVINPMREWINRSISPQSYDKWFRLMNYKDEELLKKFRIIMKFEDLNIAEWFDTIEATLEVDGRKQLKDVDFGKLAKLVNYSGMVETNAETIPGGTGSNKMTIGSGTEKITMKKSNL